MVGSTARTRCSPAHPPVCDLHQGRIPEVMAVVSTMVAVAGVVTAALTAAPLTTPIYDWNLDSFMPNEGLSMCHEPGEQWHEYDDQWQNNFGVVAGVQGVWSPPVTAYGLDYEHGLHVVTATVTSTNARTLTTTTTNTKYLLPDDHGNATDEGIIAMVSKYHDEVVSGEYDEDFEAAAPLFEVPDPVPDPEQPPVSSWEAAKEAVNAAVETIDTGKVNKFQLERRRRLAEKQLEGKLRC